MRAKQGGRLPDLDGMPLRCRRHPMVPDALAAAAAERVAREIFHRHLANWASDLMALHARGLRIPCHDAGDLPAQRAA